MRRPTPSAESPCPIDPADRLVTLTLTGGVALLAVLGVIVRGPGAMGAAEPLPALAAGVVLLLAAGLGGLSGADRLRVPRVTPPVLAGLALAVTTSALLAGAVSLWHGLALALLALIQLLLAWSRIELSLRRRVGLTAAALILATLLLDTLGREAGLPLLPAEPTPRAGLVSFLLLGLTVATLTAAGLRCAVLQLVLGELPRYSAAQTQILRRRLHVVQLAAVATAGLLAVLTYLYLIAHTRQERAVVSQTLRSLVDVKREEIESWLQERLGDARLLARSHYLNEEEAVPTPQLADYLAEMRRTYGYRGIAIYDPAGRELFQSGNAAGLVVPTGPGPAPGESALVGLVDGEEGPVGLVFRATVAAPRLGTVLLSVDAEREFFPRLRAWPGAPPSAEIYLVAREGGAIRYLSPRRALSSADARLETSGADPNRAGVQALAAAHAVSGEARDYRRQPVLFAAAPIQPADWRIVAKIDLTEAYAPVRADAWMGALGLSTALALLGGVAVLIWRGRQRRYEHERHEAERERRAAADRLAAVMRHAGDVIVLFDEQMRIVDVNERAMEVYGRTPHEMLLLTAHDLRAVAADATTLQDFAGILAGQARTFETVHRRRDGSVFPVEVNSREVDIDGRRYVLSIIRDVTQRKAQEREIERLSRLYQTISHVNQVLVRGRNRDELAAEVCRVLVEIGGFRLAWVGWLNPAENRIEPIGVAGDTTGYVPRLGLSLDPAAPAGRGPAGQAARSGRTYVCNDFFTDPATAPWREAAVAAGFRSHITLPLTESGRVVGLLAVYADEAGFFGPSEVASLENVAGDVSFGLNAFLAEQRRREAEDARHEREAIFANLFGQAIDSVAVIDAATGAFLEFNTSAHASLGYSREEFAHLGIGDIQAEHSAEDIRRNISLIMAGTGLTFETRHRHRNGEIRIVRVSAQRLRVGQRECMTAIWGDITAAKQAELELRQRSTAIEQAPSSVVITDLDGNIEYVNARFTELTGYTLAEVRGRNPRVLKSGQTPPAVFTDLWATITAGGIWRGELINRKKNGEVHAELVLVTPVKDAAGRPTHFVALKEDITERKRAEDRLRQLSRIVEQAPISVAITDLQGNLTYVNPRFTAISGYTAEEVLGQNPRVLKSGLTPPETFTEMWRTLARGEVWRGELINRRKSGEVYWEAAVIAPVADDTGALTHYVALKEDITERRRVDDALRENRDRLARAEEVALLGSWVVDHGTGELAWSDEMFRLIGLEPGAVAPSLELWIEHIHPEERAAFRPRLERAVQQRDRFVIESRLVLRDGTIKFIEGTGETIFGEDNRPKRTVGTVQDVTERKRVQIELHELVKGLRALHRMSRAVEERDRGPVELVAELLHVLPTMMSAPADVRVEVTLEGEVHAAGAPGEIVERLVAPIRINDRAAGLVTVGYVRPRPVADRGPFKLSEQQVLDSLARTVGLALGERESFAAIRRFNAELEERIAQRTSDLAQRNREVQVLLESIPDLVVRLDRAGTVRNVQPARGDTPLTTLDWAGPAATPLRAAALRTGERALREHGMVLEEAELAQAGGALAVEIRAAPLAGDEFVVFVRDITARKRLEAETAAMLEKEREVSEMKTRFISVTSHEFRTPMAAAMGSVELLINHFADLAAPKRTQLLQRVVTSMHQMTRMLDEVLLLNRMDARRVEVHPAPADLRTFLLATVDEVRLGDREAHRFVVEINGDLNGVVTDVGVLHHVVSNLLTNAVRYSPAGTTVTVTLDGGAPDLVLRVRDEGIGIPEADRERIFQPFERGSNVGQIKGTGLGLNIVQRMSALLGGTIAIAANGERGTCFQLNLPRQTPQPPTP